MNIVLIGQKWLGSEVLKNLEDIVTVNLVLTPNDSNSLYKTARSLGLPIKLVQGEIIAPLIPSDTDLLICAHAHCRVSKQAIATTKLGAIGYHPSLLPNHRGKDAIRWAIDGSEKVTGGSVYWLNEVMDGGPVEVQDWCHIRNDDTPDSLWRRELGPMGVRLLSEAVINIKSGASFATPQNEDLATWEPAFF